MAHANTPSKEHDRPKTFPSKVNGLHLASAGSEQALGNLYDVITCEICTPEVPDTVLDILHPGSVPQCCDAHGGDNTQVSLTAISILAVVVRAAISKTDLKEALAARIGDSIETICSWWDVSLNSGSMKQVYVAMEPRGTGQRARPYFTVAKTFGHFLELDSRIYRFFPNYSLCPPWNGQKLIENDGLGEYSLPYLIRHVGHLEDMIIFVVSSSPLIRRELTYAGYITADTSLLNTISLD
ncbi:hypothetical protein FA13DRAFT_1785695 [Coprinellus micaceus]|uniref:Uncharacterized protein n=1 Tax=Coprinellus micaceus TaxID=71717 RepID=A0A4Y7TUY7_COPMI|nr:hypothetical protein FA13DRAFT_1785695 [Coprinellus micaceus]